MEQSAALRIQLQDRDAAEQIRPEQQPPVEPQVETTPPPVAEAPDTTTPKQQTEDPTKQEKADE